MQFIFGVIKKTFFEYLVTRMKALNQLVKITVKLPKYYLYNELINISLTYNLMNLIVYMVRARQYDRYIAQLCHTWYVSAMF
jgi:hypothetical protein